MMEGVLLPKEVRRGTKKYEEGGGTYKEERKEEEGLIDKIWNTKQKKFREIKSENRMINL